MNVVLQDELPSLLSMKAVPDKTFPEIVFVKNRRSQVFIWRRMI